MIKACCLVDYGVRERIEYSLIGPCPSHDWHRVVADVDLGYCAFGATATEYQNAKKKTGSSHVRLVLDLCSCDEMSDLAAAEIEMHHCAFEAAAAECQSVSVRSRFAKNQIHQQMAFLRLHAWIRMAFL